MARSPHRSDSDRTPMTDSVGRSAGVHDPVGSQETVLVYSPIRLGPGRYLVEVWSVRKGVSRHYAATPYDAGSLYTRFRDQPQVITIDDNG